MTLEIDPRTYTVTHIFDCEEVVTGGEDGQVWIATFRNPRDAELFIEAARARFNSLPLSNTK